MWHIQDVSGLYTAKINKKFAVAVAVYLATNYTNSTDLNGKVETQALRLTLIVSVYITGYS